MGVLISLALLNRTAHFFNLTITIYLTLQYTLFNFKGLKIHIIFVMTQINWLLLHIRHEFIFGLSNFNSFCLLCVHIKSLFLWSSHYELYVSRMSNILSRRVAVWDKMVEIRTPEILYDFNLAFLKKTKRRT